MSLAPLKHCVDSLALGVLFPQDPCNFLVCAWGAGEMVSNLPGENATSGRESTCPAQTPSLYMDFKSDPRSTAPTFSAPRDARGGGGECEGPSLHCRKCSSRGEALETPRPFHYKLLRFNPLLETMQTLIQKVQVQ